MDQTARNEGWNGDLKTFGQISFSKGGMFGRSYEVLTLIRGSGVGSSYIIRFQPHNLTLHQIISEALRRVYLSVCLFANVLT
jgi:hypothetical protein